VSSSRKNNTYNRRSQTVSAVKQVAGEDAGGLPAQERPPGGGRPPWRRIQPVAAQRRPDRGGRDPYAKAEQFTLDALVAQRGFSLARRTISCCTFWSSGGRPVGRGG
jgi:hypothetical protein